jgi:hypothetical protein
MNNNVKLFMNEENACKILIGKETYKKTIFSSSAIQRPDMHKARLTRLLQRSLNKQANYKKKQRAYWTSFLSQYTANSANSNNQKIT